MKKVISFDKTLEFKTMVGEVTSISIDPQLDFSLDGSISGELIIAGKYKLTSASRLEDDFSFRVPVEIVLTENLEEDTREVRLDDFRYDLLDDALVCHIDLLIEGVEKIEEDVREQEVAIDSSSELINKDAVLENTMDNFFDPAVGEQVIVSNNQEKSMQQMNAEPDQELEKNVEQQENVTSLFSSFKDSDETFATYSVYIVRENDTVESIMKQYQVNRENLEEYNDLSSIAVGSKIIIPKVYE